MSQNIKIVVALGGNAIDPGIGIPTAENQQKACEKTAESIIPLVKNGNQVVLSHGNGPQVGALLIQNELSNSNKTPAMPLDTLVAQTEGSVGFWLQQAFYNSIKKNNLDTQVCSIITQVTVDKDDPAFQKPTKFVGPFYPEAEAKKLAQERGWIVKETTDGGDWRRVVPSPIPEDIIESPLIKDIVNTGSIVIAAGGGGIPVIKNNDSSLTGIEAVIDKDLTSEKLAELIDADIFMVLTAVDNVAINFGKPNQEILKSTTVSELEKYIQENHFPAGSMLPKVQAAIQFVKSHPSRKAIITSLDKAGMALNGEGTHITAG